VICGSEDKKIGLTIISQCRKAGFSVNHSLKNAAFGKQFKEAGKSGARYALILGEEEREKNEIKIKDFRSGNEKSVSQKSLIQQVEIFDEAGGIS
jgi:histidyl-tRNA synthetase